MSVNTETFAVFDTMQAAPEDIYNIGMTPAGYGTIREMSAAFNHQLVYPPTEENLGALIAEVGPAKELRDNIALVQERLGTGRDAHWIAREWVEDSGLLVPVSRSYMRPELSLPPKGPVVGVMTGGTRNWMFRRSEVVLAAGDESETPGIGDYYHSVVLAAGNRVMKMTEGEDFRGGSTEADYMEEVIAPAFAEWGIETEVVRVDDTRGDVVMDAAAMAILGHHERRHLPVVMASNAGAWVQNGGQLRRALRNAPGFEAYDARGDQFYIVSDSIDVGLTGQEPPLTHQNPFSALGQIARNVQELSRHIATR